MKIILHAMQRNDLLGKWGWSLFEGTTFQFRIAATLFISHLAWDSSTLLGEAGAPRLGVNR